MPADKFSAQIDELLRSTLKKQAKSIAAKDLLPFTPELEEKKLIKKIAFDVYRVDNDPYQSLWTLQTVDGLPHLVRAADPQFEVKEAGEWSALTSYDRDSITLNYKNVPIVRFSAKEYNFTPDDVMTFKSALLDRINGDEVFVKELLQKEPEAKRQALVKTFPEFQKFV